MDDGSDHELEDLKGVTLDVNFGQANIGGMIASEKIDDIVALWNSELVKIDDPDPKQATKYFIRDSMRSGKHHSVPGVGEMVCGAVVWLAATDPSAPEVLSLMRDGDVTLACDIAGTESGIDDFQLAIRKTSAGAG